MLRVIIPTVYLCASVLMAAAFGENVDNTISVTTTDFQFVPNRWTVMSGQEVTLTIENRGVQEHEWVLLQPGTEVTMPFGEDDESKVFWEIEATPGSTKKETFTAPMEAGTYKVVCGKPRHIERGMEAILVVK